MQIEIKEVTIGMGRRKLRFLPEEAQQLMEVLKQMMARRIVAVDGPHFVFQETPFPPRLSLWSVDLADGHVVISLKEPNVQENT